MSLLCSFITLWHFEIQDSLIWNIWSTSLILLPKNGLNSSACFHDSGQLVWVALEPAQQAISHAARTLLSQSAQKARGQHRRTGRTHSLIAKRKKCKGDCFLLGFHLNKKKIIAKDTNFAGNQDLSIIWSLKIHSIYLHAEFHLHAFLLDSVELTWRLTAVPRSVMSNYLNMRSVLFSN